MTLERIVKVAKNHHNPVFLDVGANVGDYSSSVLRLAKKLQLSSGIKLYAFEPNPACNAILTARIQDERESCFACVRDLIVSNFNGQTSFFVTGDTAGSSSLQVSSHEAARRIDASSVTLDEFCNREHISELYFVKIDTEGNDMRVLEGAIGLLKRKAINFIQFEYNHRWIFFRNFLKDAFDLLEPLQYKIAKVTPDGLEVYSQWNPELEVFWEGNYLVSRDFSPLGLPILKPVTEN